MPMNRTKAKAAADMAAAECAVPLEVLAAVVSEVGDVAKLLRATEARTESIVRRAYTEARAVRA